MNIDDSSIDVSSLVRKFFNDAELLSGLVLSRDLDLYQSKIAYHSAVMIRDLIEQTRKIKDPVSINYLHLFKG